MILFILLIVFALIQFAIVYFVKAVPHSDSALYLSLANDVVETGQLYPGSEHMYSSAVTAPGWVNLIALFLKIFGSYRAVFYFNVLLNIIILLEIYHLTEQQVGTRAAALAFILFVLLLANYGIILNLLTELSFVALVLGAAIAYLRRSVAYIILSGVMIGLAHWIRPFAMVFLILFVASHLLLRYPLKKLVPWVISVALTLFLIGSITYLSSGQFVYSSIGTGINMIMGANPTADGSYNGDVFRKDQIGYIQKGNELTVKEKDAIWKSRSLGWIKENPDEWLKLIPKKMFYLWSCDITLLYHFRTEPRVGSYSADFIGILKHFPVLNRFEWLLVFNNLIYLTIIILSVFSIYYVIKSRFYPGYIALFYIIIQTGVTLLMVGADRYHYPMLPAMIFLAAYCLDKLFQKRQNLTYRQDY